MACCVVCVKIEELAVGLAKISWEDEQKDFHSSFRSSSPLAFDCANPPLLAYSKRGQADCVTSQCKNKGELPLLPLVQGQGLRVRLLLKPAAAQDQLLTCTKGIARPCVPDIIYAHRPATD
jgi:hypothetical protein